MGIEFGNTKVWKKIKYVAEIPIKEEEVKKKNEHTVLEHIERDIQDEHEAITNYFGLKGLCDALHVDSDIKRVADEILRDEERHLTMLLALRKRLFGY